MTTLNLQVHLVSVFSGRDSLESHGNQKYYYISMMLNKVEHNSVRSTASPVSENAFCYVYSWRNITSGNR